MRKALWIVLAVLLGAGGGMAHADNIDTFAVSGSILPASGSGATCAPSPCTLGGVIAIDVTTGVIESADITLSNGTPAVTYFYGNPIYVAPYIYVGDSDGYSLGLGLTSPAVPTLVGYAGGGFGVDEIGAVSPSPALYASQDAEGTLTATTPEPSTVTLMLIGIGLLGLAMVMRKRSNGVMKNALALGC